MSKAASGEGEANRQAELFGNLEVLGAGELYEYAVLVTALEEEVLGVAQPYRDRAEAEDVFDELKNQWGWAGFTTQDHQRCRHGNVGERGDRRDVSTTGPAIRGPVIHRHKRRIFLFLDP